jgi:hypothetical protein
MTELRFVVVTGTSRFLFFFLLHSFTVRKNGLIVFLLFWIQTKLIKILKKFEYKCFLFITVSTSCYDDPINDHSGPALIKYMEDKSNDTYVKEIIINWSLFLFSVQWVHLASTVVPDNQIQLKACTSFCVIFSSDKFPLKQRTDFFKFI